MITLLTYWALIVAGALGLVLIFQASDWVVRSLRRDRRRMRSAAWELEHASARRIELLAAASELRAPLERIVSEATQMYPSVNEQHGRTLRSIIGWASRVDELLRSLLDVTALQAGTLSLRREMCDLATLVHRAIKDRRDEALGREVRVRLDVQSPLSVFADPQRIAQVSDTLLAHAIKTAPAGAEIVVSTTPTNDGVRVAVVQPAVAAAPSDLALILCRRVIETHGGEMGVETAAAGRTDWFTLPSEPRLLR